ncbi:MAG: DUF1553 domain-containing protein [Pirellulaceae bacterium]|nr:DUF1553 domain-containing protein [Pirellulaceae bacterium]
MDHRTIVSLAACGLAFAFAESTISGSPAPDVATPEESIEQPQPTVNREATFIARRDNRLEKLLPAPALPGTASSDLHPVDRFIWSSWPQENGAPNEPKRCSDATFARRVFLDVIGEIPTVDELSEFEQSTRPDKREKLIDNLLSRDDSYAAHYTSWWEDALASANSDTFGGVLTRGNYQPWIVENLTKNEPYDVMVAELIDPGLPGYRKPNEIDILGVKYNVGFLRDRSHKEILQSAADVGQVFLGTGMKCASCHDHFENQEWPQLRFLGFAGYFSPGDLAVIRCEEHLGEVAKTRWPIDHDLANTPVPEIYSERLALAAQLLTDPLNRRFSETMVNRLWKRFLGTGLYEPADDYRSNVAASHPELLAWLADDFVRHRFDIKHAIRRILNSQTYQQAYRAELADRFELDDRSAPRYFRSPNLRRLTAEQLIDSIAVAATQEHQLDRRLFRTHHGKSDDLTQALGRAATRGEVSTFRTDETAIIQALELINGSTYQRLNQFCVQRPVTESTRVDQLSGAQQQGVRLGMIRVQADGTTHDIDLTGVVTLADVMTRVNEVLKESSDKPSPGQLELSQDSFSLRSNPGHTIAFEDIGTGQTAADLGIPIQATSSPQIGNSLNRIVESIAEPRDATTLLALYQRRVKAEKIAEHLYRLTLTRSASAREVAHFKEYLQDNGYGQTVDEEAVGENSNVTSEPIVDLFWVLVTSPMFQYIY